MAKGREVLRDNGKRQKGVERDKGTEVLRVTKAQRCWERQDESEMWGKTMAGKCGKGPRQRKVERCWDK